MTVQQMFTTSELWAIAPQIKQRLLATALGNYEREVAQTELQLTQAQVQVAHAQLHIIHARTRLPSLYIIRDSLRGEVERGEML